MDILTRQKKIIYIVLGALVLVLLGFLLWRFFAPAKPKAPPPAGRVTGRVIPGLPSPGAPGAAEEASRLQELTAGESVETAMQQKLTRITDFPVLAPSLDKDGARILYYKKDGGDLLASDFTGSSQEKLSNITVVGLIEALWSPAKDRAAVFYLDQDSLKGFLHIGTSSVAVLPQDIKSFSWSPDGKSLAYLVQKGAVLQLVIADKSGKNQKSVFSTPILDAGIHWITSDKIIFGAAPSGLAPGFLFSYSRAGGSFTKIAGPLYGLTSLWSPDGSLVLIGFTGPSGRGLTLSLRNSSGQEIAAPDFATLPEKCAWAGTKTLYCAVPRALPKDAVLPDEYLTGELNTSDAIFAFDADKKELKEVFNEGDFDVSDLILAKNQDYLFFVNRLDGTLWSVKLK